MAYLPPIDERLVAALAEQFPDVSPDLAWSDDEIRFRSGQVSVVRYLKAQLVEQTTVEVR